MPKNESAERSRHGSFVPKSPREPASGRTKKITAVPTQTPLQVRSVKKSAGDSAAENDQERNQQKPLALFDEAVQLRMVAVLAFKVP